MGREPQPILVETPAPVVPPECAVAPVERRVVVEPTLAPEAGDAAALAVARLFNAQLAYLYWRDRASAAEEQADTNAGAQAACSTWAQQQ